MNVWILTIGLLLGLLGCSSPPTKKAAPVDNNSAAAPKKHVITTTNLLATARLRPWTVKGNGGFLIDHIEKGSDWDHLGVRDGDFFLNVDGEVIGDPTNISKLLTAVANPESHKVELLRKQSKSNKLKKVSLPVEDTN